MKNDGKGGGPVRASTRPPRLRAPADCFHPQNETVKCVTRGKISLSPKCARGRQRCPSCADPLEGSRSLEEPMAVTFQG